MRESAIEVINVANFAFKQAYNKSCTFDIK